MIGAWFSEAAHINGVWPRQLSAAFTSAPLPRSRRTASAAPARAQVAKGDAFVGEPFGLAPAFNSRSMLSAPALAFAQARGRGVAPSGLARLRATPAATSRAVMAASSR